MSTGTTNIPPSAGSSFAGKLAAKNLSTAQQVDLLLEDATLAHDKKIMMIAEKLLPHIKTVMQELRDEEGLLLHPARLRAIALNTANNLLNMYKNATVH